MHQYFLFKVQHEHDLLIGLQEARCCGRSLQPHEVTRLLTEGDEYHFNQREPFYIELTKPGEELVAHCSLFSLLLHSITDILQIYLF